ncbi:50S ribosomal protein L15 [Patescibacteria group bacterium]|nr:50S ribosomal protein L15 [Patescibacteria group bacterium]
MALHNLKSSKPKKSKKRLGRGFGSTRGRTSGRGQKGQKARSGVGGLKRLGLRKLMFATPKLRGFKSQQPKMEIVNLRDLSEVFQKGEVVTPKALVKKKLISTARYGVKILGTGEIEGQFQIQGCAVSKSAAEKIIKAGGNIMAE